MQPFNKLNGIVASLDRVNVDTDQIIPAQFLKRVEKTGFGPSLFYHWRYLPDGRYNTSFELNAPQYDGASILVTGHNFGCGSSREHAVWALMGYGFRAVISSSFAEIFHKNSLENGLVTVHLPEGSVKEIVDKAKNVPGYNITVDLETCIVSDALALKVPFVIHRDNKTHEFRRYCILNGLDEISLTLQNEHHIAAYEQHWWGKSFSTAER
jgi:3-isopropylmalate/(R)-2-methylmalate dehydratase small subunit